MEVVAPQFSSARLPGRAISHRSPFLRCTCGLIIVGFLCFAAFTSLADIYDSALDRRFAGPNDSTNAVSQSADATTDRQLAAIVQALKAEQRIRSEGPPPPPPKQISPTTWMLLAAAVLAIVLAFLRIIQVLNERIKNRRLLSREAEEALLRDKLIAEQPSLVAFFNELRFGLGTATQDPAAAAAVGPKMSNVEQALKLSEFFDFAPGLIVSLRTQFSKISRAPDKAVRLELLREFFCLLDALKSHATMPELHAARLMACGLQGLVQQLSMTSATVTPSVLRTAAGALDLLQCLCVPGIDPNLATRTPVELLAADDNPVCLATVSMALKKAFQKPDLAVDGTSGLTFAEKKHYDVIFLDIEMPGMNGFELCTKIRETNLNPTTPVVFVTSHSDFNSRAKSTLVGGNDLIAKPYLSFEITVQALTLALRGRLANDQGPAQSRARETAAPPAILARPIESPA